MVAAPLLLAAVERGAAADGDQRVLEGAPPLVVDMDVAGGDGGDTQIAGELAEGGIPAGVAALVRTLELDVEAVGPECGRSPGGAVRVAHPEPVACAAGETHEPLGALEQGVQRQLGRKRVGALLRPCAGVRLGQEPAEVGVALAASRRGR